MGGLPVGVGTGLGNDTRPEQLQHAPDGIAMRVALFWGLAVAEDRFAGRRLGHGEDGISTDDNAS
jgi:hypothetical protein